MTWAAPCEQLRVYLLSKAIWAQIAVIKNFDNRINDQWKAITNNSFFFIDLVGFADKALIEHE